MTVCIILSENVKNTIGGVIYVKFNQSKHTKKNGGYYLAVLLCLVAVGLVALSNTLGKQNKAESEPSAAEPIIQEFDELPSDDALTEMEGAQFGEELIVATPTDSEPTTAVLSELSSTEPTTAPTKPLTAEETEDIEAVEVSATPIIYAKPVTGYISKEFSGDTLVYSKTLGDWRVHNGTDIKCELGSLVASSAPGTIISVCDDDRYGKVVIVRHEDGSMLYYCGLAETAVKDGDTVQSGQKLGTVGVVPCECEDEPHLHLMAMRDGEFVEPVSTFGLNY